MRERTVYEANPALNEEARPWFLTSPSFGLSARLVCLALLFAAELVFLSIWLDTATLRRTVGLTGLIGDQGPATLRAIVASATLFVTFAYLKDKEGLQRLSHKLHDVPVSRNLLGAHVGVMALVGLLSYFLFGTGSSGARVDVLAGVWLLAGLLGIAFGGFAFLPARFWFELAAKTRAIWICALAAGGLAYPITAYGDLLWKSTTALTFRLVELLLRLFTSNPVVDPIQHEIGTRTFHVLISPSCSGIEGAALMLVFGIIWLVLFRRTCRFPQALLLIPAGVLAIWVMNVVRLALLILIGNAGAPNIALGGFHSQAGWISFNAVALGLSVGARRLPWFSVGNQPLPARERLQGDPNAAYLAPFLAILAAAMISRAASGQFEWLYPIRFLAAAAALWWYRSEYKRLDWGFGWLSILAGSMVFAIWLLLEPLAGPPAANSGIGSVLASASPLASFSWIGLRVLAAVITVPIAEELAFRGFLIRRVISANFLSVSYRNVTLLPVLISSIAFGFLHGDRWLAGIVAGLVYSFMFLRRGRIGEAVAAHATSNFLLAGYVLIWRQWSLW